MIYIDDDHDDDHNDEDDDNNNNYNNSYNNYSYVVYPLYTDSIYFRMLHNLCIFQHYQGTGAPAPGGRVGHSSS